MQEEAVAASRDEFLSGSSMKKAPTMEEKKAEICGDL
jgi:hypothetical protein